MAEKRLIVRDDYAWFDTVTGYVIEVEDAFDLVNELSEENEQLRKDVAKYRGNFREMEDVKCELAKENEQLKSDNFNLNKSVEYLDEIVKEQCIKLDWASECGVKWDKEFKNWKGYE